MIQNRKLYISTAGAVALTTTTVETILTILEAVSLSSSRASLISITTTASTLNGVSICCITYYTIEEVRRMRGFEMQITTAKRVLVVGSIAIAMVASLVSIVSIIMMKARWQDVTATSPSVPQLQWSSLVSGHIAMWVFSLLAQIMLYVSTLLFKNAPKAHSITTSGPRDSVMSESRPHRPSHLYLMETPQPSTLGTLPSPTFSTRSSQSLKSFRDSLQRVVRPVTSRSTLISRPSFTRDARSVYSNRQSIDTVAHTDDGFDSWDTSSVSLSARDAVLQTIPSRGTALEPIPGSRPNSPARALDGPFLTDLPEEDAEDLAPPPRMVPDISRPPSPAVSEAHIHPLFRTESPTPPMATPGTSILASPYANQAITCPSRPFNRMRSSSRASQTTVPSPLVHTKSFTNDPAMATPSRSRSSSPPSREMTPPIPDFVLNSSPRSSMSGSRRKVHLQYSPDR